MGIRNHQTTLQRIWFWMLGGLFAFIITLLLVSNAGILAGLVFITIPFVILFTISTYNNPVVGLYLLFIFTFSFFAISRYIIKDAFPLGVLFDVIIIYIYIIVFFKSFSGDIVWKKAADAPIIIFIVWVMYLISTMFNPESPGFNSWLIGVRPLIYMVFMIPLFCLLIDAKHINKFIICWGVLSVILTVKGFVQLNIGLDSIERALIAGPMRKTHLLFGQLRVFSFLSDAGQFGAIQACAGLCGGILFLGEKKIKKRLFYMVMCLTGIYGMFISGTRGAMFVLLAGGIIYLFLIKNIKLLLVGLLCGGVFIYLMMFTYIGHDNYNIRRMRTSFRPEKDASYMVRKSNQQLLKTYLADRPFGGGIGSMNPGKRGTVLGDTPPDSGFVLVWGEQGVIGLCLFIAILLFIMIKGAYLVWFKIKNEWLRIILIAMISGIGGMSVAHYGNPVLFQHPSTMVFYFSAAVIFSASRIDKELMPSNESSTINIPDNR